MPAAMNMRKRRLPWPLNAAVLGQSLGGGRGRQGLSVSMGTLVVAVLSVSALCQPVYAATVIPTDVGNNGRVVQRCGRGALLEMSGQKVLLLGGSPYEMGYQHGFLLRDSVGAMREITQFFTKAAETARPEESFGQGITLDNAVRRCCTKRLRRRRSLGVAGFWGMGAYFWGWAAAGYTVSVLSGMGSDCLLRPWYGKV